MSKKLSAKEMKQDEVHDVLEQALIKGRELLAANWQPLLGGIVTIVVVSLIVGAYSSSQERKREAGQAALGLALDDFYDAEAAAADSTITDAKSWPEVQASFQAVMAEHSGTASLMAQHFLGVSRLRAGDAAGAAKELEAVVAAGNEWVSPLSRVVLASALEANNDAAGAEAALKALQAADSLAVPADQASFQLAQFYERQGRGNEAKELYTSLADSTVDEPSTLASEAQQRLDALESDS